MGSFSVWHWLIIGVVAWWLLRKRSGLFSQVAKAAIALFMAIAVIAAVLTSGGARNEDAEIAARKEAGKIADAEALQRPMTVTPVEPAPPKLKDSERAAIYAGMRKKVDKIERITWYRDAATPEASLRTTAYLYMGEQYGLSWLRLHVQYWADTWLFVDRALIVVDGEKRGELTGSWKRDNGSGSIWEYLDLMVTGQNSGVIKAMAGAKEVTIRFYGSKGYFDYKLPPAEVRAMANMVKAFEALGGKYQ